MVTYSDFDLGILDEQYLNELSDRYGVDWTDIPFDLVHDSELNSADICNKIMYGLLGEIASNNVENQSDLEKILDRIYCNCLDSGYDINENELESEEAKEFIRNF